MKNQIVKLIGATIIFLIMIMGVGVHNLTTKFMDMSSLYMVGGLTFGAILLTYGFRPVIMALHITCNPKKKLTPDEFKIVNNALDYYSQMSFNSGLIGTLVGLVLMLYNMSDPSTIGPSMAVAIITTLYG